MVPGYGPGPDSVSACPGNSAWVTSFIPEGVKAPVRGAVVPAIGICCANEVLASEGTRIPTLLCGLDIHNSQGNDTRLSLSITVKKNGCIEWRASQSRVNMKNRGKNTQILAIP